MKVKNLGENLYAFTPEVVYTDGYVSEWDDATKSGIMSTKYDGAISQKVFHVIHQSYLVDPTNTPRRGDRVSFHFADSGLTFSYDTVPEMTVRGINITSR